MANDKNIISIFQRNKNYRQTNIGIAHKVQLLVPLNSDNDGKIPRKNET